ncbi:MAG TPA: substrate-binding domain-containing protein, partial [Bacillota bacterium]|nr:substrate-binding domain-containing protein [Bacillota bacterium]
PVLSMVDQWEGVPSILFDDYQSMRELVTHLVVQHGFKRIFFIQGPADHCYARERYRAFYDVMNEHGLFNPALVSAPTDWKPNRVVSFEELMGELAPGRDFEAIVSSNDDWAIEAIKRLNDQGFEVPEDIAVVGFNNSTHGQSIIPPLTTVSPSFYEQGRKAVEVLYQLIMGQKVFEEIKLPCELLLRQSCGCLDMGNFNKNQQLPSEPLTDELTVVARIGQMFEENGMVLPVKYIEPLVKALCDFEKAGLAHDFFRALNKAILVTVNSSNATIVWNNVFAVLQKWCKQMDIAENPERLENLWNQARILLQNDLLLNKDLINTEYKEKSWRLHMLISRLIRIFDIDELVRYLIRCIADFGFYSFYLVLYEDQQPYQNPNPKPKRARLVLAHNGDQPEVFDTSGRIFPTTDFLPEDLIKSDQLLNLIVTPIVFEHYQFGYFVCDYRDTSPLGFKSFWPQLSSCLRGRYFLTQRVKAEESLQRQKEELARSNAELQQFANVASHDLQEPLRKIMAFTERLKYSIPENMNEQSRDYLERVQNATGRMQILINDLLDYSRVTSKAQPFSEVALDEIVRDVLQDLEVKIAENQAVIEVEDLTAIDADPLQMRQLFQNLISNAIKFHRVGVNPRIRIYQRLIDESSMEFAVEDNGIGIEAAFHERIFQVFERLHSRSEYEGTGIGLAICKKIVERHHGTITVESAPNVGTCFIIRLPIKQVL